MLAVHAGVEWSGAVGKTDSAAGVSNHGVVTEGEEWIICKECIDWTRGSRRTVVCDGDWIFKCHCFVLVVLPPTPSFVGCQVGVGGAAAHLVCEGSLLLVSLGWGSASGTGVVVANIKPMSPAVVVVGVSSFFSIAFGRNFFLLVIVVSCGWFGCQCCCWLGCLLAEGSHFQLVGGGKFRGAVGFGVGFNQSGDGQAPLCGQPGEP